MTKTAENHTLWGRTYLYSPYKGVPPGGWAIVPVGSVIQDLSKSWYIKGTGESMTRADSPFPLMHHDPDRSWITDPNPASLQRNAAYYIFISRRPSKNLTFYNVYTRRDSSFCCKGRLNFSSFCVARL